MFNYRGCFCYNTSQCWPENSTMYALTNNVGIKWTTAAQSAACGCCALLAACQSCRHSH
jgi:hypothetical protein